MKQWNRSDVAVIFTLKYIANKSRKLMNTPIFTIFAFRQKIVESPVTELLNMTIIIDSVLPSLEISVNI